MRDPFEERPYVPEERGHPREFAQNRGRPAYSDATTPPVALRELREAEKRYIKEQAAVSPEAFSRAWSSPNQEAR